MVLCGHCTSSTSPNTGRQDAPWKPGSVVPSGIGWKPRNFRRGNVTSSWTCLSANFFHALTFVIVADDEATTGKRVPLPYWK